MSGYLFLGGPEDGTQHALDPDAEVYLFHVAEPIGPVGVFSEVTSFKIALYRKKYVAGPGYRVGLFVFDGYEVDPQPQVARRTATEIKDLWPACLKPKYPSTPKHNVTSTLHPDWLKRPEKDRDDGSWDE